MNVEQYIAEIIVIQIRLAKNKVVSLTNHKSQYQILSGEN